MTDPRIYGEQRRCPNVRSVGDIVRVCLPWASCSFMARITGFPGSGVRIEAVKRSDDPEVENEWTVPWACIGMAGPMDHRYA